ncbi:hypothetical protein OKW21_001346 [Catalinimonas alkaloidigena]|uniref:hypothetical protein n=1 Tax=Catalinimonas alkaloidigena TaxID=1075417 RepID=UPI002406E178|nr:hypothetical protein [Catalinimonas alkaloidigena]MDF9796083.1 hypothetical protein [Catalinimonas alkaloidigena]
MKIPKQLQREGEQLSSLKVLEEELTGSELNSYLLHLFQRRANQLRPADLFRQFEENRFVKVSEVNPLSYKTLELEWLGNAEKEGFTLLMLSPLAPLGTCSVVAEVNQNNVVSATRGTEVVSDATNMLALQVAKEQKNVNDKSKLYRYASTHQHVRGQSFSNPAFSAHFGVYCMVTGGFDTGSFSFELARLFEHLNFHYKLLSQKFGAEALLVKFFLKNKAHPFHAFLEDQLHKLTFSPELIHQDDCGDYYQLIQFKIYLKRQKMEVDLADGGLVDWTQKLLSNKKHRLFISGCGLELVHKFLNNGIY